MSKRNGGVQTPPISTRRNDSVDVIRQYLETTLDTSAFNPRVKQGNQRIIVALGDLHGNPHPALIPHIIAANPDLIVVGGDIFDLALFSSHPKSWGEETIEFETELKRIVAYFEILLVKTKAEILIMRGNHDDRFYKRLSDALPANIRIFITDPLELLVKGLDNKRVSLHEVVAKAHHPRLPVQELGKTHYLMCLGDAVISHCNFSGSNPGEAAGKLSKWLDEWHKLLGWPEPTLCIQFHTHQWCYQFRRYGFLGLVEPGMAGMPAVEGYKFGYQAKWKPGTLGACSFSQELVSGRWETRLETLRPLIP